jgi:hypothetical protein
MMSRWRASSVGFGWCIAGSVWALPLLGAPGVAAQEIAPHILRMERMQQWAAPDWGAARFLPQGQQEATHAMVPLLHRMLESKDTAIRVRALEGLAALNAEEQLPVLLAAAADPDAMVRRKAMEALRGVNADSLSQELLRHFSLPQPVLDLPELVLLGDHLGSRLLQIAQASDTTSERQRAALYLLGRMDYVPALDALLQGLFGDDPMLVWVCAQGLASLSSPKVIPHWVDALEHELLDVRVLALRRLTALGGGEAFLALRATALGGASLPELEQGEAIDALLDWPAFAAVPVLIQLMEESPSHGAMAWRHLQEMSGLGSDWNSVQWRVWYAAGMPEPQPMVENYKIPIVTNMSSP